MNSRIITVAFFILYFGLSTCTMKTTEHTKTPMQINFETVEKSFFPIQLEIHGDSLPVFIFLNGSERIEARTEKIEAKKIRVEMPVFESYFILEKQNESWHGTYHDPSRGSDYSINVYTSTQVPEWQKSIEPNAKIYEFYYGKNLEFSGYGLFETIDNQMRGTIRSEIGDYRYLSGWKNGNSFVFQTFDGSHVYHFKGEENDKGIIKGTFYSGNHFSAPFELRPTDEMQLDDPTKLTQVVSPINFTLPLSPQDSISFPNSAYSDRVVLIQILGSWCPNCMDETRFIVDELYANYHSKGLEIIGIAFERYRDDSKNFEAIAKMKNDLKVPYPIALGGFADKREAGEVLPFLSEVISFPTTIIISKKGEIVKVHTGFDGPGTGTPYEKHVTETKTLIEKLLADTL